eukprot:462964_1
MPNIYLGNKFAVLLILSKSCRHLEYNIIFFCRMDKQPQIKRLWFSVNIIFFSLLLFCIFAYVYSFIQFNVNYEDRFIKISLIGDISLSRHINNAIHNEFNSDFTAFVSGFSDITKNDDLTFANLESSISNHTYISCTAYEKLFINSKYKPQWPCMRLCAPQININLLKSASVDVVTIANNHIFDCTQYGILDTIDVLENNDIPYVGIGDVLYHKQRIFIKKLYNVKIGMLGFYANKNWFDPNHKLNHNNTTNALNIENIPSFIDDYRTKYFLCGDLKYYKDVLKVDILMVYIHWLDEYMYFDDLTANKKYITFHNLVNALSECGVDVIIGSHPHVLIQPQWITNKQNHKTLILWSLGNFVFDSSTVINRTHKTCLAQLLIDKNTKTISNIRFREGFISNNPTFQTILTGDWQESFCKSHI